ncbi:4-hydroxythreonine-4-phosphate dehydrogenase PdxA [Bacteriovoracaceae bacterium]|nr:4-hydroxythreonine-4-phosphate dehydrogenase PdxA [Bacteriovoracaceae bacterium]
MIHVSSGHPKGIGLEIFLKSMFLLTKEELSNITLYTSKKVLEENLALLGLKHCLVKTVFLETQNLACDSLELAIETMNDDDILVTLPTSKDTLSWKGTNTKGYTEYFRKRFNKELTMCFLDDDSLNVLLTDHIPLSQVTDNLSLDVINTKIDLALTTAKRVGFSVNELLFSGINPHAGENGLLGTDEEVLKEYIKSTNSKLPIFGPYPADTIFNMYRPNQLRIFSYHDQGLTLFKQKNLLKGINITCGLPFLRFSVDHGTAFDLYGKNKANPMGIYYVLKKALTLG